MKTVFLLLALAGAGSAWAGPHNIAPSARVSVSSELSPEQSGDRLVDGLIAIEGQGEWASRSQENFWGGIDYPWARLEWPSPQTINRVVLYDRAIRESHTGGGTLHFSDGSRIAVTTIPKNGLAKQIDFPAKRVTWLRFEVTDGHGPHLGLSEIEVYPAPEDYVDYVSLVDPYVETVRGRFFYFITGRLPFGMVGAAPMTRNKNQFGGGYNYNSLEVLGFPQIHDWMLSGINLMPTTGPVDPRLGEAGWKSAYRHEGEIVQPGYHRIFLQDYGIWVEQTATERVSFYRLRYTRAAESQILVHLGGYLGSTTMNDARITRVSATEIEGSFNSTGRLWGGPEDVRIFFVIQFDRAFQDLKGWNETELVSGIDTWRGANTKTPRNPGMSYYDAPNAGAAALYPVEAGDVIQLKCAISYTSIENARRNLQEECDHWDFDAVRLASRRIWNEWLGKIEVRGGTDEQRIKFYTDLWHVLLGRGKLDDVSGDYPDYTQGERVGSFTRNAQLRVRTLPRNPDGTVRHHMYGSDAFWLTQWNLNVLWGLGWPDVLDDFAACLVQYDANGGLLPRGPCAGGYSYIMTGCPATFLIVSAHQKGMLTKTCPEQAYQAMARNHRPGGMLGSVSGIQHYIEHGFYPGNAGITLEAAFQDWALAQMAKRMGRAEEAAYYLKRSSGWTSLFDEEQKLIFPKNREGHWIHRDPLSGRGWVEANSWQCTWSVSHDIPRLAELMGGNDVLCEMLHYAMTEAAKDDFAFGYSHGHISYANQPACSSAHVFNHAGQPWRSQYWVRRVNEQTYGGVAPDRGYGGHDEDQGQMGGISALMSIGLFSLRGTTAEYPVYEITSPVFDEVILHLDPRYYRGDRFTIRVHQQSAEHPYIQKAALNRKPLSRFWIGHDELAAGGLLELWLGPEPNREWGLVPPLPRRP